MSHQPSFFDTTDIASDVTKTQPNSSAMPQQNPSINTPNQTKTPSLDLDLNLPDATSDAPIRANLPPASPSIWHRPQISMRWWPIFLRNLLVWRKLAIPSLIGNIAEPLMWLVAFGYGMGALIGQITVNGVAVPYILFLASGSICMSAMNAASFEALYSAFSRMHVQRTWDGIMNAPISLDNIVLAEMLWAGFKATFTITAILGVMLALGISHSPKLLLAWPVLVAAGIMFASIALIFNALAKSYDFFTYYFTLVLTPMMFLSGVFFPLQQLPALVQNIAKWLPLTNAVALVRPLFMDQWPPNALLHIAVMATYTIVGFWLALVLTRRRFNR